MADADSKPQAAPTPSNPKPPTGQGLIGQSGNKPGSSIKSLVNPPTPNPAVTAPDWKTS